MRATTVVTFFLSLCTILLFGQERSAKEKFLDEQKTAGKTFSAFFYPDYIKFYSLPEKEFVRKIDSVRNVFNSTLKKYEPQLEPEFAATQRLEIKYYFDKLLIDYEGNHNTYLQTEKYIPASKELSKRLEKNLVDFNNRELLSNRDFTEYARAFFHHAINKELENPVYENTDNQTLTAVWKIIPKVMADDSCRDFWRTEYLFKHLDNNGIKNTDLIVKDFRATCGNSASLKKINTIYAEDSLGRQGHTIKVYKTVSGVDLDVHVFTPDPKQFPNKHPVFVYFHGGSWSEGKPDWGFSSCESYAKKGWVGVAVEYRTAGRNNTLPFESVMDARSCIRWLRQNANLFKLDTARIVATGNSAGGHLVLATALANQVNEKTDDTHFSPTPNVLLVNSGVYDLTIGNTMWITKDLKDKEFVKQISPNHLDKKNVPPLLVIHGTNDQNCPYWTAEKFKEQMQKTNNTFEFHSLPGANHYIWFDQRFTEQISKWRQEFLEKLGY